MQKFNICTTQNQDIGIAWDTPMITDDLLAWVRYSAANELYPIIIKGKINEVIDPIDPYVDNLNGNLRLVQDKGGMRLVLPNYLCDEHEYEALDPTDYIEWSVECIKKRIREMVENGSRNRINPG